MELPMAAPDSTIKFFSEVTFDSWLLMKLLFLRECEVTPLLPIWPPPAELVAEDWPTDLAGPPMPDIR